MANVRRLQDLNKACPKDCYPLPRIDQLVDSTAVHELLSFLDAYQGYHQILLAKEDQNKMSFVKTKGTYCYVVMSFSLKNAGATYQRLMDRAQAQPNKCTLGVKTGKFLGYMVTRRSTDRSFPFFKVLQRERNFEWNEQSEETNQELKAYLKEFPRPPQTNPRGRVASLPVYHPSGCQLGPSKKRARKLRPYFLSHPITVLTSSTLGRIAAHPDALGRLIKWVTELSEYDIRYEPRKAIKAQVLADFVAETVQLEEEEQWRNLVDGSSFQTRSGVGIVLISPWREETGISVRLDFKASNNEAEYEALLLGLKAAQNLGVSRAILYSDSQLAIQQSNGKYEVKSDKMIKYARAMNNVKEEFSELILELIPRTDN
ncbi:uncharacterized protein [Primulina eburnea]|uniref:uncharacterized protein n=1 Tax=Primulina eburnea TaxID=1245227 RepID=UPI003C6C989D